MKRLFLLLLCLTLGTTTVSAQKWLDALKGVASSAVDQATGGKLTQHLIVGTWNYAAPGVKFESGNTMSNLAASAVEGSVSEKLTRAYQFIGIKPGATTFTFSKENNEQTFTAKLASYTLGGTWEFEPETHVITLHFTRGERQLGTVTGHAYLSGTELQLVFPVTKLMNMLTELGSKVSSLETITSLLKQYENVYLGFKFTKQ